MSKVSYFTDNVLSPELAFWGAERDGRYPPLVRMCRAAVFEAFLWLRLGVEIGYFSAPDASEIAAVFLTQYFTSLEPRNKTSVKKIVEPFRVELPLVDSPVFAEVLGFFPDSQYVLRAAIEKQDLFSFGEPEFEQPEKLAAPFQALLLITGDFVGDELAQAAVGALSFWEPSEWELLMKKQQGTSPEEVNAVPQQDIGALSSDDPAVIDAGFLRTLNHMNVFKDLCTDLLSCDLLPKTDGPRLLRRVREMHGWRIDLRRPHTEKRVSELTRYLNSKINQELKSRQEAPKGLQDYFRSFAVSATEFWGPERALAGASA